MNMSDMAPEHVQTCGRRCTRSLRSCSRQRRSLATVDLREYDLDAVERMLGVLALMLTPQLLGPPLQATSV